MPPSYRVSRPSSSLHRRKQLEVPVGQKGVATSDGEWLTMTPKGFFAASPKGTEMLAVVRGFESYSVPEPTQETDSGPSRVSSGRPLLEVKEWSEQPSGGTYRRR